MAVVIDEVELCLTDIYNDVLEIAAGIIVVDVGVFEGDRAVAGVVSGGIFYLYLDKMALP